MEKFRVAQYLKEAILAEQGIEADVFDSVGNLVSEPTQSTKRDAHINVWEAERDSKRYISVLKDGAVRYYLDCGQELSQTQLDAIKMFAAFVMNMESDAGREEISRSESRLVKKILQKDAKLNYDDIVDEAAEIGYKIEHPMAVIVASLEVDRLYFLNLDLDYHSAEVEAKRSIVKELKDHVYMNRHDIVAFINRNTLVIFKAIEDTEDIQTLYRVTEKISEAVDEVLKAYRIFKYYIAPAEIIESFDKSFEVYEKSMSYISYAQKMNLEHTIIDTNDILYYSIIVGMPKQGLFDIVNPKVEYLQRYNQVMVEGLIQCFDAFIDNGCNIAKTADATYLHRNTVKKYLDKLYAMTGFDPQGDFKSMLMNKLILQQYLIANKEKLQ
ncbi:MAG: helix-turn-helix domain-containing protein [Oscillospiraceae bacterium]|nr:helix-turn-helix domain-containing protein [Oscillospiraceae bacterium]